MLFAQIWYCGSYSGWGAFGVLRIMVVEFVVACWILRVCLVSLWVWLVLNLTGLVLVV